MAAEQEGKSHVAVELEVGEFLLAGSLVASECGVTTGVRHVKKKDSNGNSAITLAYEVFSSSSQPSDRAVPEYTRIMAIMGFAAPRDAWLPVTKCLLERHVNAQVCMFDNRGIGGSTVPAGKSAYNTSIMAEDVHTIMDELQWDKAHVMGFSMGGMIASKFAARFSERVLSLLLLSVTGGGAQIIPLSCSAMLNGMRALLDRSDSGRNKADIMFHYSSGMLARKMPDGHTVNHELQKEYQRAAEQYGRQAPDGEKGHLHACWTHHLSSDEAEALARACFPVRLVHGCQDLLAMPKYGIKMAKRLRAPIVMLTGGHMITRECAAQVVEELLVNITAAARPRPAADITDDMGMAVPPQPCCCWCC